MVERWQHIPEYTVSMLLFQNLYQGQDPHHQKDCVRVCLYVLKEKKGNRLMYSLIM